MKNEESLYIGIAVVVALLFMFSFFVPSSESLINNPGGEFDLTNQDSTQDFFSQEYNFGFNYPDGPNGYNLTQSFAETENSPAMTLILTPKANPPLISQSNIQIKVYNPTESGDTLTEWLETNPDINALEITNSSQQGQFAGRDALWFQTDNPTLATDNLAIRNNNTILLLTANYQTVSDNLKTDFIDLIQSIRFQNI